MSALAAAYEVHALAHLLPEMRPAEYAELRDDIAANGLREAITLYQGKVLDGRHRYRACTDLGVWPDFTTYEGDAPAAFVLSLNVKRRQLTQSQKAMLATDFLPHLSAEAKERQRRHGGTAPGRPAEHLASEDSKCSAINKGRSAQHAAEQVGVGHAQVVRASTIKRENPELAERVRNGEVTVGAAYAQVTTPREVAAERKPSNPNGDTERGRQQMEAAKLRLEKAIGTCNGIDRGFASLRPDLAAAVATPDEIKGWIGALLDAEKAIKQLRSQLKEPS